MKRVTVLWSCRAACTCFHAVNCHLWDFVAGCGHPSHRHHMYQRCAINGGWHLAWGLGSCLVWYSTHHSVCFVCSHQSGCSIWLRKNKGFFSDSLEKAKTSCCHFWSVLLYSCNFVRLPRCSAMCRGSYILSSQYCVMILCVWSFTCILGSVVLRAERLLKWKPGFLTTS